MMTSISRTALILCAGVLLASCANFASISPGDSAQLVADRVGRPGTVWTNADGSEVWEYPEGPEGFETFMITFGPDQNVREVHQVLSEPFFSKVHPGMSREEVHRLLGRPREIWYFPPRNEESWVWRYFDITYRFFNVLFDRTTGKVRTVLRLDEALPLDGRRGRR